MNATHPFFEHIRKQHPRPEQFHDFVEASHRPLRKSIRVNTLKINITEFKKLAAKRGWLLSPIPWCNEGFWVADDDSESNLDLGNSGEHLMGLCYIQEASSMMPASALFNSQYFDKVFDMAAAPGSKTTQLAALMNNNGTLLANDLSASRLKVLQIGRAHV